MRRPAFQFYPGDWRRDTSLQACSIGARGLWIELMCIMHECEPYGTLSVNGAPMKAGQVARIVGETERTIKALMKELEDAGVFSRDADGIPYSRRMVADERVRASRAAGGEGGKEHGAKGGEHGAKGGRPNKEKGENKTPLKTPLAHETETPLVTPLKTPHEALKKPPPSSSSSSSERNNQFDTTTESVSDTARAPADNPGGGGVSNADLVRNASPDVMAQATALRDKLELKLNCGTAVTAAPIIALLQAGGTPELIEATIDDVLRNKPSYSGLNYFLPAVRRAIEMSKRTDQPGKPEKFDAGAYFANLKKQRSES